MSRDNHAVFAAQSFRGPDGVAAPPAGVPNLARDVTTGMAESLWRAAITYIRLRNKFVCPGGCWSDAYVARVMLGRWAATLDRNWPCRRLAWR